MPVFAALVAFIPTTCGVRTRRRRSGGLTMIHCSELTKKFRRNGSEVVSLDRVSLRSGPVNSWSCAGQAAR